MRLRDRDHGYRFTTLPSKIFSEGYRIEKTARYLQNKNKSEKRDDN